MTLRLSTLLRDRLMGEQVGTGTRSMSRTAADKINDGGNGFLTDGFVPGMAVYIDVFTTSAVDAYAMITKVEAGILTVSDVTLTTESAENGQVVAEAQSFLDIFAYGVMKIYTGSQPASADDAPTGTLLLIISKDGVAVVPGTSTNGLEFDAPVDGVLGKKDAHVWSDVALATGTAGWFRFYTNGIDEDGNGCNFDGAIGTSGAELNLSSTSIVLAATTTIDEFEVTLPAS